MFDMDGTLLDSAPSVLRRLSETLTEFGVTPPADSALIHFIGPPILNTLTEFLAPDDVIAAAKFYRGLADRDGLDRMELYRGIPQVLSALANAGIPLGIASSKPQHEVEFITAHFGITDFFTATVGSSDERVTKSQVVIETLRLLNHNAHDNALMVGDRIWDIDGAAEHGIPTVLVSWGYAAAGEEAKAIAHITSTNALTDFIMNGSMA